MEKVFKETYYRKSHSKEDATSPSLSQMEKSCYQKQMKQEKIYHFCKKIPKLSIVAVNLNTEEISGLHSQGHTGETGLLRTRTSEFRPAPDTQYASWGFLCARTFPSGKRK